MSIRVKWVHFYKYKDNNDNIYTYYILKTVGCSYIFWLMINNEYQISFDNDIDMFNDISKRRLIRL